MCDNLSAIQLDHAMSESLLIDEPISTVGGAADSFANYKQRILDCINTAKLVYKQIKPKPEKLKKSLFAAELEQDYEVEVAEEKKKVKLADDIDKLQRLLSKTLSVCI